MSNIILIGMPGAGKSTVGVVLAKRLGLSFVDSDLVIQDHENRLLHEIIEQDGLDGFIQIENEINSMIEVNCSVIATGGSVIFGTEAMEHFRRIGKIVYLKISYDSLVERLGDLDERGVAHKENQTLLDIFNERKPYYERYADITIECDDKPIRDIVLEIAQKSK